MTCTGKIASARCCQGWETFSQIPEHGTVSMSYKCAPEDRNFKARNLSLPPSFNP